MSRSYSLPLAFLLGVAACAAIGASLFGPSLIRPAVPASQSGLSMAQGVYVADLTVGGDPRLAQARDAVSMTLTLTGDQVTLRAQVPGLPDQEVPLALCRETGNRLLMETTESGGECGPAAVVFEDFGSALLCVQNCDPVLPTLYRKQAP